jgi:hypothetical protein
VSRTSLAERRWIHDGRDEARLVAGLEELAAAVLAARDPGTIEEFVQQQKERRRA